jgi:hypothetical protein
MADNLEAPKASNIKVKRSGELLPKNARTDKIIESRRAEEAKLSKNEQEKVMLEKDRERKRKEKRRKDKEQKEKLEAEQERKRIEDEQERSRLGGKTKLISQRLKTNTSPAQYSLSGIELSPETVGVLCRDVSFNKTLKCLHLAKKKITDDQGAALADMLSRNTFLVKLELEGNLLGPKTALQFGKVLKGKDKKQRAIKNDDDEENEKESHQNETLRYLDLENNFLTQSGATYYEVKSFSDCLLTNKTLLHLNVGNNAMNEECSERFVESTKVNTSLICFEFGMNNFKLEHIKEIKENLVRNKQAYDDERFKEWKERKRMADEESQMRILNTMEQKDTMVKEEAEANRIAREKARDAAWKEFLLESEVEKQRLIQRLEEAAKMRKSKPKKRGRKGGKKKQ